MKRKNVMILGAAGRDFHNFNMYYRDNNDVNVVAFTAAQIPDIDDRKYPAQLAGPLYPRGIPIYSQDGLQSLIRKMNVDECVFSYSDVPYSYVMRVSAAVNAAGANFLLLGPDATMLKSVKPVIAVGAVRTGCGKSQTSRRIAELLNAKGIKPVLVRHPMPYGDLVAQKVQRYAKVEDLKKYNCTIEEMEEYEPHISSGNVIYSGVDYAAILAQAEKDPGGCDVVIWDGGNNDFPFFRPDLMVTVTDPHRPGHEIAYYPGEVTLRIADVVIINKIDSADPKDVETVKNNIAEVNPKAEVILAASKIEVDDPGVIKGNRVLVVEDGPTLTHGGMKLGAGVVAALNFGAKEIVDPRPFLSGKLADTFKQYPDIGSLLPAMGYGERQIKDLQATIEQTECDSVVIGTPIDLTRIIKISKPVTRVHYSLKEIGSPDLSKIIDRFIAKAVK